MRISSGITHFENFMNQMIRYLLCEPKLTKITQMSNTTIIASTDWCNKLADCGSQCCHTYEPRRATSKIANRLVRRRTYSAILRVLKMSEKGRLVTSSRCFWHLSTWGKLRLNLVGDGWTFCGLRPSPYMLFETDCAWLARKSLVNVIKTDRKSVV